MLFGGDPSIQMSFAIETCEIIQNERRKDDGSKNVFRICWETNGMISKKYLRKAVELSLESGGCIKFDLKAYSPNLYMALTGSDCREIFENFRFCGEFIHIRKVPPLLLASTLLIPGYIDSSEIFNIASFISEMNPEIPYALLAFHPDYLMSDLPFTSREQAESCLDAARSAGLKNVKVGNIHILNHGL
jgi:pyruvate formate lyase activating enzyme